MKKKLLITIVVLVFLVCMMVACNPGGGTQNGDNDYEYVTVTFDTQGGSAIDSQRIKKGESAIEPTTIPKKDGYEFDDWYTQKVGGVKFDFALPIMSDTVVYAVYTVHVHTFDNEHWAYDANYHWHASTCGHTDAVADKQAHDFLGNVCKICDYENDEEHIHVLTHHEAKNATCTEQGNNAYWECPRCGKYFSDSTGESEIDLSAVQINALGHAYDNASGSWSWNNEYTQATYTVECSRCDDQKMYTAQGENIIVGESQEPTCTADGFVYYSATVTIDSVEYSSQSVKKTISLLGHDYENGEWKYNSANHWKVCARCGNAGERTLHSFGDKGICECGMVEIAPTSEFRFISLGNNTWRLTNYTGSRQMVSIPSEYNRGTVVEISDNAFNGCVSIETLIIPDTITSIGAGAFAGCVNIKHITISANAETIGAGAFADSNLITTAVLPANAIGYIPKDNLNNVTVTSGIIAENAFANCTNLNQVKIKSSVTSIKNNAFENCAQLTNIQIENGLNSIGENAFKGCSALSDISVPNSVTSIGQAAFRGCSGLESITLPFVGGSANANSPSASTSFGYVFGTESYIGSFETVQIWGTETTQQAAYYIPSYLKRVSVGGNILYGAFYGCDRIESITMTSSKLKSFGDYAFYNCVNLKNIEFPDSVVSIGEMAFAYCLLLEGIPFSGNTNFVGANAMIESSWYSSQPDGVVYIGKTLYVYKGVIPSGAEIVVDENTKSISDYAFAGCMNFAITIPESVPNIGEFSFENCRFTSITCAANHLAYFSKNATQYLTITTGSIQENALKNWDQLKTLNIMNGVTSIGKSAFEGSTGLTSVIIGNGVTGIGERAFFGCSGLTEINWNAGSVSINSDSNVFYNAGKAGAGIKVTFGDSVQRIPAYLFYVSYSSSSPKIKSVTIPDSVTSIGSYVFSGCSGLTSITIPESVTFIESYAFRGCTGLTSITIPDSVTSIDYYAFEGCSGLTSVVIGNSVTGIGNAAFSGCSGLTEINWNAGSVSINSDSNVFFDAGKAGAGITVTFGDNVQKIPAYLFYVSNSYVSPHFPNIKSVTISDSVMSIGSYAFRYCSGLTSITIPESVTSIGERAFSACTGLTSITIPNSVTSIDKYAFSGCTGLTSVTIGDSVTSIGEGAFYGCTGLTSVTIPDSVTRIGKSAFSGCTGLTSVTIPNSVTSIGESAFSGCTGLTSVTIPNSVTSIGESAFSGCTGLTSVTIGDSVAGMGKYAFKGCTGLTEINWNAGSVNIGSDVFSDAGKTSVGITVTFGDSVQRIPGNLFRVLDSSNRPNIKSVTISNSVTSIGESAFSSCTGLTSITIPDSVTSIGERAFSACTGLTSITIPNSVTSIGRYAFSGCTGLTSIVIPYNVAEMGESVFWDCRNLQVQCEAPARPSGWISKWKETYEKYDKDTGGFYYYSDLNITWGYNNITESSYTFIIKNNEAVLLKYQGTETDVVIPQNFDNYIVTSIGLYAFEECTGLTSVTIPDSVTSIGYRAFNGCTKLTSVTIGNGVMSIGNYAFNGCTGLTSVIIPDSVTSIGNYAFNGCTGLTSITIPNSVTSIGNYAFYGCTGLTSVTIPDSVTSIGAAAFSGCRGLTSIAIPDSVTSIGSSAFFDCTGLTSITIPNSVTSIGDQAFYNCRKLQDIYITDIGAWCNISGLDNLMEYGSNNKNLYINNELVTSIAIPDSVTSIGNYAFYGCTGLTSVTIPDSVTSIGNDAFNGCTGLTSVTIPDSVTSIGYRAFNGCTKLTSVTIGNGVTSIGNGAFYGCTGLTSVIFEETTGWTAGSTVISSARLSDPSAAAEYLKNNSNTWKRSA